MNLMISAPNFSDLRQLKEFVEQNFAGVNAVWLVEHKDDGRHGAIHGDSATFTDDVTIGRSLTVVPGDPSSDSVFFAGRDAFGTRVAMRGSHLQNPVQITGTVRTAQGSGGNTGVSVVGSVITALNGINSHGTLFTGIFQEAPAGSPLTLAAVTIAEPIVGIDGATPLRTAALHIIDAVNIPVTERNWAIYVGGGPSHLGDGVYERQRTNAMGEWITTPFNAANFTGNGGMTWTVEAGDQRADSYMLVGDTLYWNFAYVTTTVTGGPSDTELRATIPGGFQATVDSFQPMAFVTDNGVVQDIYARPVTSGSTQMRFVKKAGGNWADSANNTLVTGQMIIQIG